MIVIITVKMAILQEEKFNLLHHGVTMDNISIVHASIRLGADVNAVDEVSRQIS